MRNTEIEDELSWKLMVTPLTPPFWCIVSKVPHMNRELVYDWPRIFSLVDDAQGWIRVAATPAERAFQYVEREYADRYEMRQVKRGQTTELWLRTKENQA